MKAKDRLSLIPPDKGCVKLFRQDPCNGPAADLMKQTGRIAHRANNQIKFRL